MAGLTHFIAGFLLLGALIFSSSEASAASPFVTFGNTTNFIGKSTNGPGVYSMFSVTRTNFARNPHYRTNGWLASLDTNKVPPAVVARLLDLGREEFKVESVVLVTNAVFERHLPETLNHCVWTNLIARTNGRTTRLWSTRTHPVGWPTNSPAVQWDTRSLVFGNQGFTALSPCWEGEGYSGQAPITALTRRHGYTRGHGVGEAGFRTHYRGKKVWFVAADNKLITMTIAREVVRTPAKGTNDYTLVLFDKDLPASIEPLSVIRHADLLAKYKHTPDAPWPMFCTEQGGHVSAGVPGFIVPFFKAGDSGSPNLLPLPGELVFAGGRTTSAPSEQMQADMDELCRLERLNPKRYQMRWADLSRWPSY